MSSYRMLYGDDEDLATETLDDVEIDREDGWTTFFRGTDSVLRVRDEHIRSLEVLDASGEWQPVVAER